MRFSESTQAFYDDAYERNAFMDDIPPDVAVISVEQYRAFFTAINSACRVYAIGDDFHLSAPRPDGYHAWDTGSKQWVLTDEGESQQKADEALSASRMKLQLLASAQAVISEWQSELLLGVIGDEDKARLITWLAYIKALKAIDTSAGQTIQWPIAPV